MKEPHRRGVCPGLSVPLPTGDGLLVRLMPTAPVPLDAFVELCEAARRHGNGIIEISARGSLQVRGLTPRSAPLFASAVAELGIATHEGVPVIAALDLIGAELAYGRRVGKAERAHPVPPPYPSAPAGEGVGTARKERVFAHPTIDRTRTKFVHVNAADVAAELRRAIANARLVLSPKISIVVDGGGPLHLDALTADVRLRAAGPAERPRFFVGLGGDGASATWLGSVELKDVVDAVLGILTTIAVYGPTARASEVLSAEGVEAFRSISAAVIEPSSAPPQRVPTEMIGRHSARDGTVAVGIGLAFGHAQADALAELARLAARHGTQAVWPVPDRALLLTRVSASNAPNLTSAANQLGFVVHARDARRRIAACPGAPACTSGLIPARALALALTPMLEPDMKPERNSILVHISGCPKGCAHPMPAAITLVGTPRGCGVVHNGTARAMPDRYVGDVSPENLSAEISKIAAKTFEAAHG
jgi:precorrin-3B synthase